jgi:hypothetical protein
LVAFYDQVAVPALMLAERDRARGTLDDEHRARVAETATAMVDDLAEHEDRATPDEDQQSAEAGEHTAAAPDPPPEPIEPPPGWHDRPVLCVGARGNLDQAAATMLAQLVERCGIGTRLAPVDALEPARIVQLDTKGIRVVCLSYMNEDSAAHARYMVRRLRRKLPTAAILVGFWMATPDDEGRSRTLERIKADFFATSLREALEQVRGHARSGERNAAGTTALVARRDRPRANHHRHDHPQSRG